MDFHAVIEAILGCELRLQGFTAVGSRRHRHDTTQDHSNSVIGLEDLKKCSSIGLEDLKNVRLCQRGP